MSILSLQQLEIAEEEGGALLGSTASFQCHNTSFH